MFVVGPLARGRRLRCGRSGTARWSRSTSSCCSSSATVTGLGTSLGYHRLLTHRSFRTTPWIEATALAAGAMAVPSRPIDWAARHLEHHAHADREGDPHSPVDGLLHAHVGWLFGVSPAKRERYCRRLMRRPGGDADRAHALALARARAGVPALIDGWRGLLWGGIVRMAIHNHTMFAVNSVCHASARSRSRPATRAATTG